MDGDDGSGGLYGVEVASSWNERHGMAMRAHDHFALLARCLVQHPRQISRQIVEAHAPAKPFLLAGACCPGDVKPRGADAGKSVEHCARLAVSYPRVVRSESVV